MSVELVDGRVVCIRPIAPSDADALVRFHESLTSTTTRLRFFSLHPHLSVSEVERFTRVDHHDREALVAVDGSDIVGVGRYDRVPDTNDAEVAFVVAEGWQGKGAGTQLLDRLVDRARMEGLTGLVADTLDENSRMRGVFRRSGLVSETRSESGVVSVVLDLRRDVGAATRHRS